MWPMVGGYFWSGWYIFCRRTEACFAALKRLYEDSLRFFVKAGCSYWSCRGKNSRWIARFMDCGTVSSSWMDRCINMPRRYLFRGKVRERKAPLFRRVKFKSRVRSISYIICKSESLRYRYYIHTCTVECDREYQIIYMSYWCRIVWNCTIHIDTSWVYMFRLKKIHNWYIFKICAQQKKSFGQQINWLEKDEPIFR